MVMAGLELRERSEMRGDFNGHMTWMGVIGRNGLPGQLLDFGANHSLSITIIMFEHKTSVCAVGTTTFSASDQRSIL